jgi:hypothetical protein
VITAKSVNKVNQEIDGLTDKQLDLAIDRLFDGQPEVLAFLDGFSGGEGRVLELSTLLSFFIFKAYETEYPGKAATVKREDFESVFDEAKTWMAELERPEAYNDPPPETEPLLFGYIIQNLNKHLNEPPEDNRYAGYKQRAILMMLKMVILALDRAASRRSAEDI